MGINSYGGLNGFGGYNVYNLNKKPEIKQTDNNDKQYEEGNKTEPHTNKPDNSTNYFDDDKQKDNGKGIHKIVTEMENFYLANKGNKINKPKF